MGYNIEKSNVIEPEIITENGENISKPSESMPPNSWRARILWGLSLIAGLLTSVLMFVLFAIIAIIIAVPMLILSLFGKKPNIKIFKYKM